VGGGGGGLGLKRGGGGGKECFLFKMSRWALMPIHRGHKAVGSLRRPLTSL